METGTVYVSRCRGLSTVFRSSEDFADEISATIQALVNQGLEVISVVPNTGLFETEGVWIFWRTRDEAAPRLAPDSEDV